jgi:hypothetical protein
MCLLMPPGESGGTCNLSQRSPVVGYVMNHEVCGWKAIILLSDIIMIILRCEIKTLDFSCMDAIPNKFQASYRYA